MCLITNFFPVCLPLSIFKSYLTVLGRSPHYSFIWLLLTLKLGLFFFISLQTLIGLSVEVKESSLNAVSSISGCGLGFLFLVIEGLSDGGVRVGLPRALSMQMVAQTMIGAGRLIQETGKHPGQVKTKFYQLCLN